MVIVLPICNSVVNHYAEDFPICFNMLVCITRSGFKMDSIYLYFFYFLRINSYFERVQQKNTRPKIC